MKMVSGRKGLTGDNVIFGFREWVPRVLKFPPRRLSSNHLAKVGMVKSGDVIGRLTVKTQSTGKGF
jgi:hypothetical protein